MELEAVIRSVVEHDGLELVEASLVRLQGRRVLQVTIDRPGVGLDLDTIAQVSDKISRRLDLEGFEPGPYSLDVGSPGLERPLKAPRDFMRRVGERVKVRIAPRGGTAETLVGDIVRADERDVTIATEAGERTVAHWYIAKARTVFEWAGQAKRASSA
jgi:ribosome maturation factor RimP